MNYQIMLLWGLHSKSGESNQKILWNLTVLHEQVTEEVVVPFELTVFPFACEETSQRIVQLARGDEESVKEL